MKNRTIVIVIAFVFLQGCASMIPYGNTAKLQEKYLATGAVANSSLVVKSPISLQPGATKFTFPAGVYKPTAKTEDYIYYMSPEGTFVEPVVGSSYFVEGGIRVFNKTGNLEFMSLGTVPTGKQRNLKDYGNNIELTDKDLTKLTGEFRLDENGKPHGVYREINATGDTQASGMLEHGKMVGKWTYWVSTGTKVAELELQDGVLNGPCEMWYGPFFAGGRYAGQIKLRMSYKQGLLQGERIRFYPDGSKESVTEFNEGKPLKTRVWDASGKELSAGAASESLVWSIQADKKYLDILMKPTGLK